MSHCGSCSGSSCDRNFGMMLGGRQQPDLGRCGHSAPKSTEGQYQPRAALLTLDLFARPVVADWGNDGHGKHPGCAALTVAKAKKVKLVISTATVNLMEQLQNKDLPTLAKSFPGGFTFGLAKGRGRYLCLEKLAHRLESSTQASLSLDENDASQLTPDASSTEPIPLYRKLADMIDSQTCARYRTARTRKFGSPACHKNCAWCSTLRT